MQICSCIEVNLLIGLSGVGKTTIVNKLCGREMAPAASPQNGIKASTVLVEEVVCGDQTMVDAVGLMHMTEGVAIEDAYFAGLSELLTYMDGKKVGRIYVVADSTYMKDIGRVIEQVDFLKSAVNPLIPWTGVVNCFHGICQSALPQESRAEFFSLLAERVENVVEVVSPNVQPVSKALFPTPGAYFPVNLPLDWQSLLHNTKISSLRDAMMEKARAQCDVLQGAVRSAQSAVFHCDSAQCSAFDCSAFPECPPPTCPDFHCPSDGECKRHRREAYRCHFMNTGTCHRDHHWDDQDCLRAARECRQRRTDGCNNYNAVRNDCMVNRDRSCDAQKAAHAVCVEARARDCAARSREHDRAKEAVLSQHRPQYERCVLALGYPAL